MYGDVNTCDVNIAIYCIIIEHVVNRAYDITIRACSHEVIIKYMAREYVVILAAM